MFGKITKDNAFLLYIIVALYQNPLSQSKLRLTSTSAQAVSVDSANQKYYELFIHRRLFSYFFRFQCMSFYDWYGKNGCHEKYFSFQFISNKCSIVAFFLSLSPFFSLIVHSALKLWMNDVFHMHSQNPIRNGHLFIAIINSQGFDILLILLYFGMQKIMYGYLFILNGLFTN